ncbi:hypothetical protein PhaeoP88_00135 [Phaeobacter inhibens]|uniref:Uncharacterized protein n=1 Tax=Phaeobacter inhibens TaxID=221822 RepID=A0A2I7K4L2_9RHOB|nr:hypothetical protein PhaeoP88_00135 [Phaeobacter inhibens]
MGKDRSVLGNFLVMTNYRRPGAQRQTFNAGVTKRVFLKTAHTGQPPAQMGKMALNQSYLMI